MVKKSYVIILICVIVGIFLGFMPKKPKIVSSITTVDTTYLTILVDKKEILNMGKLEEKILKMCKDNTFDNMKLSTENRKFPLKWRIFVYASEKDLEIGAPCLTIQYDEGE